MPLAESRLFRLLTRHYRGFGRLQAAEQATVFINAAWLVIIAPFALIGLVWLVIRTDLGVAQGEFPTLLVLLILMLWFTRNAFRFELTVASNATVRVSGSFDSVIYWSAALVFGPTAVWLVVFSDLLVWVYAVGREANLSARFALTTERLVSILVGVWAPLIGLTVFEWLGGVYPYGPPTLAAFIPALAATAVVGLFPNVYIMLVPTLVGRYVSWFDGPWTDLSGRDLAQVLTVGSGLSVSLALFSLLGALIFTNVGPLIYLFFAVGVLLAGLLTNRLTRSIERAEQRSRELAVLEALGRDLIGMPPGDRDALAAILREHVPDMVPGGRVQVVLDPDVLLTPASATMPWLLSAEARQTYLASDAAYAFVDDVVVTEATGGATAHDGVLVAIDSDGGERLGSVYALVRRDQERIANFLPALQSVAAQIASAIERGAAHERALANERMQKELDVAAQIQASFLPTEVPDIDQWQIAATLIPARQCSGDFYDFIPLPGGKLGIIVADVADKGTGAALYMALSRTVIRGFAMQSAENPAHVLQQANARILQDTTSTQFVTVFYAIIDTRTGVMTYCNAGHNPTFVMRAADGAVESLGETGIPLGMVDDIPWEQAVCRIGPGDRLLFYTDGVPEAQNAAEALFDESRLLAAALTGGASARAVQEAIIDTVGRFTGDAPQFDDMTLVVVQRDDV